MKLSTLAVLLVGLAKGLAQDQALLDASEVVQLTTTQAVETKPAKDMPGFERLLDKISIVPSEGSSPASYIVAGRVVSGNSGAPLERIPIPIGTEGVEPIVAGLTNVDGEFRFRLWIKEDDRELGIQTNKNLDGYLYVGGSGDTIIFGQDTFSPQGATRFAQYRRYPLKRLLELSPIPKQ